MKKQKVLQRAQKMGYVDNFWAFKHYILRLSAVVYELKEDGYDFEGKSGFIAGKQKKFHKNHYYYLK